MTTEGNLIEILLVEDNSGDVELTREAFTECKLRNHIHVAEDGEEALDFLHRRGQFRDAVQPDIILLDLNLPRKNGKEALEDIKQDSDLCKIPVIILTSSEAERDMYMGYKLHANRFITKPVNLEKFIAIIREIETFWLSVVRVDEDSVSAPGEKIV